MAVDDLTVKSIIAGVGVPDKFVDGAYDKALYWDSWVESGDVSVLDGAGAKQKVLIKALRDMISADGLSGSELDEVVAAVYARILAWREWSGADTYIPDFPDFDVPGVGRNER